MRSVAALKKQVDRLARDVRKGQIQAVEFITCWGDEIPEDWEEGSYFKTEWGSGTLEDDEGDSDA